MLGVRKSSRKTTGAVLLVFVAGLFIILSLSYDGLRKSDPGGDPSLKPERLRLLKSGGRGDDSHNQLDEVKDPLGVFGVEIVKATRHLNKIQQREHDTSVEPSTMRDVDKSHRSHVLKPASSTTANDGEVVGKRWFGTGDPQPPELVGFPLANCDAFQPIEAPLSGLELEIIRLWNISLAVMEEIGATYWPTDGTLLGLMRNGRVATDRDIDFQIHSTKDKCHGYLNSLKPLFSKRASLQSFKVVDQKIKTGKIGRYAMVRVHRKYGSFSTGVDFNCVYTDDAKGPHFFTHRGVYTPVPDSVFPLGKCMFYGHEVPCPRNGYAVLEALKPRYEGCMVYPHCIGDPKISIKKCMSPHPRVPMASFVENTKQLASCGYTALAAHLQAEPACNPLLSMGEKLASNKCEGGVCFLQGFKG